MRKRAQSGVAWSPRRGFRVWLALGLSILLTGTVAGCGAHSAAAGKSTTFVDMTGQCPVNPGPGSAEVCIRSRQANAVAGSFKVHRKLWGFAYSYNCGAKPGQFFVVAGFPSADMQMAATGNMLTGRKGRGYQMVTPHMTANALFGASRDMGISESVQMLTTCAWHVRALDGSAQAVRQAVPPIPTSVNESLAEQGAKEGYAR